MQISDAEWIVMNLIWSSSPIEAADDRIAAANKWSSATVKTMLRLVRKGALAAEQNGKKYLYTPAVRRAACVRQASRSLPGASLRR